MALVGKEYHLEWLNNHADEVGDFLKKLDKNLKFLTSEEGIREKEAEIKNKAKEHLDAVEKILSELKIIKPRIFGNPFLLRGKALRPIHEYVSTLQTAVNPVPSPIALVIPQDLDKFVRAAMVFEYIRIGLQAVQHTRHGSKKVSDSDLQGILNKRNNLVVAMMIYSFENKQKTTIENMILKYCTFVFNKALHENKFYISSTKQSSRNVCVIGDQTTGILNRFVSFTLANYKKTVANFQVTQANYILKKTGFIKRWGRYNDEKSIKCILQYKEDDDFWRLYFIVHLFNMVLNTFQDNSTYKLEWVPNYSSIKWCLESCGKTTNETQPVYYDVDDGVDKENDKNFSRYLPLFCSINIIYKDNTIDFEFPHHISTTDLNVDITSFISSLIEKIRTQWNSHCSQQQAISPTLTKTVSTNKIKNKPTPTRPLVDPVESITSHFTKYIITGFTNIDTIPKRLEKVNNFLITKNNLVPFKSSSLSLKNTKDIASHYSGLLNRTLKITDTLYNECYQSIISEHDNIGSIVILQ